jgi:hypothetical protein
VAALLEAASVGVNLQDVDMVSDAIQQSAAEPFRAEKANKSGSS